MRLVLEHFPFHTYPLTMPRFPVPLKAIASDLSLFLHELDTFNNWNAPPGTNLIIAVSFGLFVPHRILSSAKYGGLNVHPSLLPESVPSLFISPPLSTH
jgi:hypothetical protein